MHFSRVCCSARMHEDDARWPTVHTTGALSDVNPPDFDAGIRWLVDRKTSNAARAIRGLLVSFFAWDPRLCAPAPSQLLPAVRAVECAVSNAADPCVGAPCPLVCLVCRPGGRPTFSCDTEAHAVRERPSSASAHAPGGASLYNGEMARFLGLSSAGDVSVLGRPASVMRARRTACTYPSAANPHTACCRLRIYMEGNARIYVNGQLPGPPSVHSPPLLI